MSNDRHDVLAPLVPPLAALIGVLQREVSPDVLAARGGIGWLDEEVREFKNELTDRVPRSYVLSAMEAADVIGITLALLVHHSPVTADTLAKLIVAKLISGGNPKKAR